MRLLICAGGTGGGVYPALAVLQALQSRDNDSHQRGSREVPSQDAPLEVLWVGGEGGMEAELVNRAHIPFKTIPASGVHGIGWRALPGNLLRLGRGFLAARRILNQFRPHALFFTGGFVSVPVALAARIPSRGLPRARSLVYVPDIEPGLALRILLRTSDHAAITTNQTRSFLPARIPASVTGYPMRAGLERWHPEEARKTLDLRAELPILLVLGGSRGAQSINRAVMKVLPQLLERLQVVHISGVRDWDEVQELAASLVPVQRERYRSYPYLHDEIGAALACANLVVSRAGASCIGEYPMFGLPAILVPYPYAWKYQRVNALFLVKRGAAVMVEDAHLAVKLFPMVDELMADSSRLEQMSIAMRSLARPNASRDIAAILLDLANKTEGRGILPW